ncbi:unnamed protein product, partial [Ascophyllum nodosum]
ERRADGAQHFHRPLHAAGYHARHGEAVAHHGPSQGAVGEAGSATAVTKRAASSLQAVTTSTRKMLRDAIIKRFFNKRYDEAVFAVPEPSYVFEMAA